MLPTARAESAGALWRQDRCVHATWLMAACLAEWCNGPVSRYRYVPWPAPRQGRCRLGERMGGERGCAVAELQVSEVSSGLQGLEVTFEFYASTSAPGRIRTCAHGSGGRCCVPL